MSTNNFKFFDFEVYPEWWCCAVSDEEETYPGGMYNNAFDKETEERIKNKMRMYDSDEDAESVRQRLKADLLIGIISGYNIKRYDLIIAKCIFAGFTPRKLYIASELIMHPEYANKDAEYKRVYEYIKWGWNEAEAWQDLMDDSDKGLKDKECSLGIDLRETTVPFGKRNLTLQDKLDIKFYNRHDVYALHVYFVTTAKAYIDTKIQLCDIFGLPHKVGYTNTNAVLCGKVLEAQRVHNTTITDPTITIRDPKLKAYFEEHIPHDVYNQLLTSQGSRRAIMYNNLVSIADGGLHSEYFFEDIAYRLGAPKIYGIIPDIPALKKIFGKETEVVDDIKKSSTKGTYGKAKPALYVEATDEWTMFNIDASSCYTSVMIYCDAMSRAIKNPARLKDIYLRRMKLKATPKKEWTKDDFYFVAAAKLILNTTFGAMGNKYLTLFDDYMRSKTCRVGQMILIALSNCFYKNVPSIKIIQNNTDGILVYARRSDYNLLKSLVNEFCEISNFIFEIEEDSRLWQLNVNNYIAISPSGEVKNKGGTFITSVYQKGYNKLRPLGNHCVSNAMIDYYTKGINPVKHLIDNTKISDFCLTCTKGPTYDNMIQYNKNGVLELGKVARVIAVTDDSYGPVKKCGMIKKTTKNKREGDLKEDSVALCPEHALVVNDALYNYKIENQQLKHIDGRVWNIDYAYYARELDKVLNIVWYKMKNEKLAFTKELNL